MLDLPLLNVRLRACHEDWQQMIPTAQGRHCRSCDREVVDLTAATHADLLVARAASPDGRVCGRVRQAQLAANQPAPLPRHIVLRPRLRQFLVALVLVCGLGLTSGEAWAQVRKATTAHKPAARKPVTRKPPPPELETVTVFSGDIIAHDPEPEVVLEEPAVFSYVEQMPEFKEGGTAGAIRFVQQHLRWPPNTGLLDAEGRVFVNFIVGPDGKLREFKVLKGIHPLLDAEALRVARLLDGQFTPGQQNGRPVEVYYTIPVTFQR
ncbi:energy transducer TonB [Hymenobacter cellulosivorans]|uniref:Energy transducer TonB n=1 Tax=Hymenobacter cellulosivorans TaxID=2932249 RepID=A0ABY4FB02_9BACT|nr:energy transducer TonB [Hymenobacter cellulosivorans]UOQ53856.1 energy transducer TonB [Hymenobacter cellulosivorans]